MTDAHHMRSQQLGWGGLLNGTQSTQSRGGKRGMLHMPVGRDEGFLDTVTVMHIQIQVQHPGMILEQLQNG